MSRPLAFLEVGAMFEEHWTGIPNVAAAIAMEGLRDPTIDWQFVYDNLVVPDSLVERFLDQRSGKSDVRLLADLAWQKKTVPRSVARQAACIFTNIKPVRRFFQREASIIHDLSAIVTPQYHHVDTIVHVANRIRSDIETSDRLFCVSRATLEDVRTYFSVPDERLSVLPLGVEIDLAHVSTARAQMLSGGSVEPYIVVVGTLEPRKNGRLILEYLARNPDFSNRFRIVFIGRDGWLDEQARLMATVADAGVAADRVVFMGFVSEAEKVALILNSAFCVYPSFFEGFGLPILEAAALGKITVCSNSSSMPEVAPDLCVFFNPLSVHELSSALEIAEQRASITRSSKRALPDIAARAAALDWRRCYSEISTWVRGQ